MNNESNNMSNLSSNVHQVESITQDSLTEYFSDLNKKLEEEVLFTKYNIKIPRVMYRRNVEGKYILKVDFDDLKELLGIGLRGPVFTIHYIYPPSYKYPGTEYEILGELIIKGIKYAGVRVDASDMKYESEKTCDIYKELDTKEKVWQTFGRVLKEFSDFNIETKSPIACIWDVRIKNCAVLYSVDRDTVIYALLWFIKRAYNSTLIPATIR